MIKTFKQIPEPLQRQVLYKVGYGAVILLVTVILLFCTMEWFSVVACFVATIFCFISAFTLFRRSVIGDYVVISGECIGANITAVRKRTKMIVLRTEDNQILKVMMTNRLKKINVGSKIILYIASNMPVYEKDGAILLYSYLAIHRN